MKKLLIPLLLFAFIAACDNANNDNAQNDKTETKANDDKKGNGADRNDDENAGKNNRKRNSGGYKWEVDEQNSLLEDCRRESAEKLTGVKLKEFCACVLTEAQKYYSRYDQMNETADTDNDRKILEECLGYYPPDREN